MINFKMLFKEAEETMKLAARISMKSWNIRTLGSPLRIISLLVYYPGYSHSVKFSEGLKMESIEKMVNCGLGTQYFKGDNTLKTIIQVKSLWPFLIPKNYQGSLFTTVCIEQNFYKSSNHNPFTFWEKKIRSREMEWLSPNHTSSGESWLGSKALEPAFALPLTLVQHSTCLLTIANWLFPGYLASNLVIL